MPFIALAAVIVVIGAVSIVVDRNYIR